MPPHPVKIPNPRKLKVSQSFTVKSLAEALVKGKSPGVPFHRITSQYS